MASVARSREQWKTEAHEYLHRSTSRREQRFIPGQLGTEVAGLKVSDHVLVSVFVTP